MTTFDVVVKPTSITVYPASEAFPLLSPLIFLLEYEDEYREEVVRVGYLVDEQHDILYLHKGVSIDYLKQLLTKIHITYQPADTFVEMKFDYEELVPPRDNQQVDVINFIAGLDEHSSNKDR